MAYYTVELYEFLDRLSRNNYREWFNAHKAEYLELRALWLADIDRLIAAMAQWNPAIGRQRGADCAYRIYRDTRFSPDKTPYKTFFSAAICEWGRKSDHAGYYIEIGRPSSYAQGLFAGLWCPTPLQLRKMRHAIVDNIDEWQQLLSTPGMQSVWQGWCSSCLKTIPKGWQRNHPCAEYLKMTNYGKFHPCDDAFFFDSSWPEHAAEMLEAVSPFVDFINYSLDE